MTQPPPPTEDLIRYDVMVQEALLSVVRKVLVETAQHGLPGDHHFYITFRSNAPGVRLSQRLKEKYPDEMTIVLQYQFRDLIVTETGFEVGLSFANVPERLIVPFDALTGFYDPSVQFGLKFTPDEALPDNDVGAGDNTPGVKADLETIASHEKSAARKPAAKPRSESTGSKAEPVSPRKKGKPTPEAKPAEPAADSGPDAPPGGAEVVSLDAFRKKK